MARLRYRRSIKIAPGVRVNVTHRGVSSISAGAGGLRVSQSLRGSKRPAASRRGANTAAERLMAAQARQVERLGPEEVARRRRVNAAIFRWFGLALAWVLALSLPVLLVAVVPLTRWMVYRAVQRRRARRLAPRTDVG